MIFFPGGKSSPSPPPPDVAQCDLMMRLGLLLGDKGSSSEQPICQTQTEETFTSVSSLGSSEAQDRGISDASPFSTLTGIKPKYFVLPFLFGKAFFRFAICWKFGSPEKKTEKRIIAYYLLIN